VSALHRVPQRDDDAEARIVFMRSRGGVAVRQVRGRYLTNCALVLRAGEGPLVPLKSILIERGKEIDFLWSADVGVRMIFEYRVDPGRGALLSTQPDERWLHIGSPGRVLLPAMRRAAIEASPITLELRVPSSAPAECGWRCRQAPGVCAAQRST